MTFAVKLIILSLTLFGFPNNSQQQNTGSPSECTDTRPNYCQGNMAVKCNIDVFRITYCKKTCNNCGPATIPGETTTTTARDFTACVDQRPYYCLTNMETRCRRSMFKNYYR